ncbi:MAG: LytTR family DNA-binding domain-containing protein [Cyclobacteriaceae bacterium]|nr:MAG: LytTR family DNA-binding domain-containing protein [Cyclobacteriaceae bacterium]
MNVLIIEDEIQAARRLENLINELLPQAIISGRTDSVKSAVKWFNNNPHPDLIFMDIQLGDGLSFEIFEMTTISAPVIFTTAYDEYALKAFKVNSIDYILKPVDKDELRGALEKFNTLKLTNVGKVDFSNSITQVMELLTKKYKERFVIKVGEHLRTVEVKDILYFFSSDKATFCTTREGRSHILDFTLDQLELMVNPEEFFRINRKYLVGTAAIQDIISHTNSRLKLILKDCPDQDIIVSRERVQEFKQWLDR